MFCGRINPKKIYQKPNILRRKSKAPVTPNKSKNGPSPKDVQTGVPLKNWCYSKLGQEAVPSTTTSSNAWKLKARPETTSTDSNCKASDPKPLVMTNLILEQSLHNNNNEEETQSYINAELFLDEADNSQLDSQYDVIDDDWCTNTSEGIVIGNVDGLNLESDAEENSTIMKMIPMTEITSKQQTKNCTHELPNVNISSQNLAIEYLANTTMKYKCDLPNCTKRFKSEQKLKKHKLAHNTVKPPKEFKIECPAKIEVDGVMKTCAMLFYEKDKLAQHLNTEHTTNDAAYKCSSCGRTFFWAVGMRAHARAGCGGGGGDGALPCPWAGCGAAFRHPCRLREHARMHTGDRPYPCHFPNCGWSFRTSSKLNRHARRHTGERRYVCAVCGRAFPRREHLRHHLATHHRPHYLCPQSSCQRKFVNVSALVSHLKKQHQEEPSALDNYAVVYPVEPTVTIGCESAEGKKATYKNHVPYEEDSEAIGAEEPTAEDPYNAFLVNSDSEKIETGPVESESVETDMNVVQEEVDISMPEDSESNLMGGRAARTHCTWPLQKHHTMIHHAADFEQQLLDGDVQVELLEGGESNIYTVRSDLFLHGNVLNNEDSVQMASVSVSEGEAGGGVGGAALDSDLGLLEPHSACDLMQEELLYTDAVDESSYHVFLLSGEEIQIV